MLTESQFREIADSLRDIVNELKKMNKSTLPPQVFTVKAGPGGGMGRVITTNQHNFERSDHSGPSIA